MYVDFWHNNYTFFGEIKMAWDDDKKAQAVSMYEEQDPTPETSMEIVKDIADLEGDKIVGARTIPIIFGNEIMFIFFAPIEH